jgi:multiple sugar transport system permease protein
MTKKDTSLGWIYLFLAPTIITYSLYTVWPTISTVLISFQSWSGFERSGQFCGLDNYSELFQDPLFWNSLKVTFTFLILVVPLRLLISLGFALLLNWKKMLFRSFFRTIIFIPVVTTGAIIGVVMNMIFDPLNGPVNLFMQLLGLNLEPIAYLGSAKYVLGTAGFIWVWKWLGVTLIYWLASLQSIPEELYEAATVDGASILQVFRNITLPLLRPFAIIISILSLSDAMRVFDLMLTLTGGGPFFKTEVIELFIYRWAFSSTIPRLGYASAAATIFGLIFILFTILQLSINRNKQMKDLK